MNTTTSGWLNGLIGVLIFSGSLPATRVAVMDFDPIFLTAARAAIAGVLAVGLLMTIRVTRPTREDAIPLLIVAVGVVLGFPLFTALALQYITAAHSIVFIAVLPLATAFFAVVRAGERPNPAFWVFSIIGSALVAGFALFNDASASLIGDGLMLIAIIACGLGYAEGAKLSSKLGGWQVISWALLISLPIMLPLSLWLIPTDLKTVSTSACASVGQLQLLQPFFGLLLAHLFLGESISAMMIATALLVVVCVVGARRAA